VTKNSFAFFSISFANSLLYFLPYLFFRSELWYHDNAYHSYHLKNCCAVFMEMLWSYSDYIIWNSAKKQFILYNLNGDKTRSSKDSREVRRMGKENPVSFWCWLLSINTSHFPQGYMFCTYFIVRKLNLALNMFYIPINI